MPLCSVVIPWYKDFAYLRRAVDSVLAQDQQDFEIIVVANGVTDENYAKVCSLYSDPRYRTARLPNAGGAEARNHGLFLARGHLVFFLDADDRFHPAKFSRFLEWHKAPGFHVAFSRGLRMRANGVSWPFPVGHWDGTRPVAEYFFCDGCTISSSAIVVSASVRDRVRFNTEARTYEDPDLIIRAEHSGLDVKMFSEPLYDWYDDAAADRMSRNVDWDRRLAWIESLPDNVSQKARTAFRARCVAQHVFPVHPFRCLGFFSDALLTGAIPPRDVILFMVRGLLPVSVRDSLLNRYFLRRAERFRTRENVQQQSGAAIAPDDRVGGPDPAPSSSKT